MSMWGPEITQRVVARDGVELHVAEAGADLLDGGAGWQDFVHIAGMVAQGGLWGSNAPTIEITRPALRTNRMDHIAVNTRISRRKASA